MDKNEANESSVKLIAPEMVLLVFFPRASLSFLPFPLPLHYVLVFALSTPWVSEDVVCVTHSFLFNFA